MQQYSDDLSGLLQALNIASAHIVGISLGGGIAFQFAIDHPTQVKTVTIINSAPTLGEPAQAKQEVDRRVGIVQQMGMRAMGQALAPTLFPKPEHAALRETFIERWASNDPRAYIEATRSMLNWNVIPQLGTIHCPALVLAADQDYSPVAVKEMYVKLMPNAQLVVIADARHAVPIEKPTEFNAALSKFLAEHN